MLGGSRAVILSTGRAGSGYIARLLTDAGVPCGHEDVFKFTRKGFRGLKADSSWLALPYVERGEFDGRVFHQVRHPLDVLSSLLNGDMEANAAKPYAHYQQAHLHGDYPTGDYRTFAVRFVVDWNRRCEQQAEQTWRVEHVDMEVVATVAAAVGVKVSVGRAKVALRKTPTTTNKHPDGPRLDWADLDGIDGADDLRAQARRYGYRR